MRRWYQTRVLLGVPILALSGLSVSGHDGMLRQATAGAAQMCSWMGTWHTEFAEPNETPTKTTVMLDQVGDAVTGTYDFQNGHIVGHLAQNQPDRLNALWAQGDGEYGRLTFKMAPDCQSFAGSWAYQLGGVNATGTSEPNQGPWYGTRAAG